MKLCILASGSSGNAAYIEGENVRVLLDAGLSGKEIEKRLSQIDVGGKELDAIVVTHGHRDHIHGVGILARRFKLPIYVNQGTLTELEPLVGGKEKIVKFTKSFKIGNLHFEPFAVSHDAVEPVMFNIRESENKIAFVTDLGHPTHLVKQRLLDADLIVLEANHDKEMTLKNPIYPWKLKQRIMSRVGHLSNNTCGETLKEVISPRVKHIFLAHLSENNNDPSLAYDTVAKYLDNHKKDNLDLQLAFRDRVAKFIELK